MRSVFVFLILLCLLLVGCMEGRKASPLARLGVGQTSPETQLAPPTPKDTIPAPPPKIEPNLYELLGFQKGVNQIVDDFILLAVGDEKVPDRIKKPLQGDNAEAAKKCLSSCSPTGPAARRWGKG